MSERKGTKALELWCKRLIHKDCPDVQIENMTTSWRNGIAFCALVHHFRPDLIDMSKLKPEDTYKNNQLAFSIAEKHLGIPALLDAEDMVENDVPDRLSILTYLSQFYQRLGHKVNTKSSESESKLSSTPADVTKPNAPLSFGKTGLDKCTACSLPVYLAQRLLVSHKLYHRRCFRCSKCSGHLNPKNFHIIEGSEFCCDSCKNEKSLSKLINNNDQIGMLAFNEISIDCKTEEQTNVKQKIRPQSVLEKISLFEKNNDKEPNLDSKIVNRDNLITNQKEVNNGLSSKDFEFPTAQIVPAEPEDKKFDLPEVPENLYKSNSDKLSFLQTQLSESCTEVDKMITSINSIDKEFTHNTVLKTNYIQKTDDKSVISIKVDQQSIITTDDSKTQDIQNNSHQSEQGNLPDSLHKDVSEITISVPPRRKKHNNSNNKMPVPTIKIDPVSLTDQQEYPVHLNPFSDDENENEEVKKRPQRVSTNPFGSSDEDDVPPIQPPSKPINNNVMTPVKRLIAVNPFWSDGEEPSTDEEEYSNRCSMATSTPNLAGSGARRKKGRAPPPPPPPLTHVDDVLSVSSLSSCTSTIHSDQKSIGKNTPTPKKKRPVPMLDSLSTTSGGGSPERVADSSGVRSFTSDGASGGGRRGKGPAPGLPLPERRAVRLHMSPHQLQAELDLLETQQLGLERQGVLIERMIRDKCEGDPEAVVPQEEVEDLVIQLCELVNEKNDLFRKQTELMYIRRQQRLEQEQADIEHEIRIIQSRPAVNRIDADKDREEQLVARLVQIVRLRDELVQQLDAERRRERQEDIAIATSIANKRAQRNSDSSSMKSELVATPKKNKVKDKVKKQLKKAKNTLISKKKEETDPKESKLEKEKLK